MKKLGILLPLLLVVFFVSSCISLGSLFPSVYAPIGNDSSLLVVEAGVPAGGALFNSNASGWAPWVVDASGKVIPFRTFDGESRLDSLFYSANLESGTYYLRGFYHVFVDYSKLPEGEIPFYGPFENYPYHVKQTFPLERPVEIVIGKGEVATLGRYFISYDWVEGVAGISDQRWRVNPSTTISLLKWV